MVCACAKAEEVKNVGVITFSLSLHFVEIEFVPVSEYALVQKRFSTQYVALALSFQIACSDISARHVSSSRYANYFQLSLQLPSCLLSGKNLN